MYKKLRTFRFCAAIMSPGCPPPAVPAVCCPQYPPLPVVLCPPRPAALRLRYPPSVACDSRRLLPFLLRGLMPSACGTRCQPVACIAVRLLPAVPASACCPLSSVLCPLSSVLCPLSSVLRGLPPSAWGTRRPPVVSCACFCPLPGAVRCLPGPRGRAAVRKKSRPGSGRLGQGAICTLPYFLAAFLSAA